MENRKSFHGISKKLQLIAEEFYQTVQVGGRQHAVEAFTLGLEIQSLLD
jgi:hypothetical protein